MVNVIFLALSSGSISCKVTKCVHVIINCLFCFLKENTHNNNICKEKNRKKNLEHKLKLTKKTIFKTETYMIIMCGGSFLTDRKALVRKRKGLASEYARLVLLWLA